MGITHIVQFQFKSDISADVIEDTCKRMLALKDTCLHPVSQQPYIKSSFGGKDNSIEGIQNGITHAFVVEFENAEDRDFYVRSDSVHHAFVKSLDGLIDKAQVIDFTHGKY
ncbi:hypothetical protein ASPWEDRAFT_58679 [Aspergillus wentii DTO 134E9]|uniref:Stress-response A/B barrel domain-containing protein n=1 Tax=Aspergillus wentii DTO 134E9 TaxID=1073089 RepID=A0A1L9RPQ1_ASPWE|nr:uncharacterized protein ASPWEDRAFT_58679 [Aspergillus wentii DTO 134E9]KAI9923935.1 hypothetical protein MW887_008241 [Aspergillus wentii]OJJ36926.1 hypothetical protein ASPWEDRAFT_58679 [Aspergillus wentii DTO 134E9]